MPAHKPGRPVCSCQLRVAGIDQGCHLLLHHAHALAPPLAALLRPPALAALPLETGPFASVALLSGHSRFGGPRQRRRLNITKLERCRKDGSRRFDAPRRMCYDAEGVLYNEEGVAYAVVHQANSDYHPELCRLQREDVARRWAAALRARPK